LLTPRAVFEHQTVAALAAAATLIEEAAASEPDVAIGGMPATPIMRMFAELGGPIEGFHQAMVLQGPAGGGEGDVGGARPRRRVWGRLIWLARCRLCWITTTGCGCGLSGPRRRASWRLRLRPAGRWMRAPACGASMCLGLTRPGGAACSARRRERRRSGFRRGRGGCCRRDGLIAGGLRAGGGRVAVTLGGVGGG